MLSRLNILPECLVCEITIQNKKIYFANMYRSPSQNNINLNLAFLVLKICLLAYFCQNPNLLLFQVSSMPIHQHGGQMILLSLWQSNDIDISIPNGTLIDYLTTTHGFKQLISNATHILPQSSPSIGLIFTCQPNYVNDCST